MEIWEEYKLERDKYEFLYSSFNMSISYDYRVEFSYMYFDDENFGEDEFYDYIAFETLQNAIKFKELLEKVKILDIPKLNECTYLVGDIKIYKVVFETRELIM